MRERCSELNRRDVSLKGISVFQCPPIFDVFTVCYSFVKRNKISITCDNAEIKGGTMKLPERNKVNDPNNAPYP